MAIWKLARQNMSPEEEKEEKCLSNRRRKGVREMELENKKKYEFQTDRESKVLLEIEVKIKDMNKEDMEDILHEVASCTHNFYLDLGKKIASDN